MLKRILIILGHPDKDSLNGAIADAYERGAREEGYEVKRINVGELEFDPVLWKGYKVIQELEPDLLKVQQLMEWAEKLVFIHPVWWQGMPSLLKGMFDRMYLPQFSFKYETDEAYKPTGLLKNRVAQAIMTMDEPVFVYKLFFKAPATKALKVVLQVGGIKLKSVKHFGSTRLKDRGTTEKWVKKAEELGRQLSLWARIKRKMGQKV